VEQTEPVTSTPPDLVPLGRAPRPSTGEDLAARLRATLAQHLENSDAVRVFAEVDGADVPQLQVDATGLVVGELPGSLTRSAVSVDGRERTPGIIGAFRLDAHPATVAGVPVDVRAELANVPFAWVDGQDGSLAAELLEPTADAPVTGDLRVAAPRERLLEAVRSQVTALAAAQGVAVSRLDIRLVSEGPRAVSVVADAKLRKGLLSASARGRATATVDDALGLTLSDVEVSSGNPLVTALLSVARGRLDQVAGKRIDLAGQLPPGIRLSDVRLDVGEDVVLTVRAT
jgi:hypothetical protein